VISKRGWRIIIVFNFENIQPMTLFSALWYIVPLLYLGEWGKRKFDLNRKDPRIPLYVYLAGCEWKVIGRER